jgi:hypothetical protein
MKKLIKILNVVSVNWVLLFTFNRTFNPINLKLSEFYKWQPWDYLSGDTTIASATFFSMIAIITFNYFFIKSFFNKN